MGLFKPAWMSDDKEKALKAIEKETEQAILSEIIQKSRYDEIRIAALEKLIDQTILADITKSNHYDSVEYCKAVIMEER